MRINLFIEAISAQRLNITETAYRFYERNTMRHRKYKRINRLTKALIAIITSLTLITGMYGIVVFTNLEPFATYRNIWITTAMTTFTHQWLATKFFPEWLIDDIMVQNDEQLPQKIEVDASAIVNATPLPQVEDPLKQNTLTVGENDENGNKVIVNDIDEGIVIVEINGKDKLGKYVARLALIDDPSRVFLGTTNKKEVYGQVICEMMENYNSVLAINASGFYDPDGHGKGGIVNGLCYSEGVAWGKYNSAYSSIIITNSNRLVVGDFSDWENYDVRDGAQFFPVVISNGEIMVDDQWGHQPRTIIAQREDGVMMFLIVDGRSVTSTGCTYKQCANILLSYGAINAAACDGGSSSVLAYDGKVISIPSTPMKDTGRYLPNAFMVRSKKSA